ncbi:tetratricopeptide repeat protein [Longimicrobium sp.]|uniref:tetratricopeptide repeat protein n=1 Tax=Longimicrobium sp. TaxID=2029185 RepID=UPI003B3B7B04
MSQPVFISYARDASRDKAQALHHALGGRTAFLDTADIAPGERFPEALVDALFSARVVVIFAEPQYFTRWYCLLEFRIARTPFLRAAERPGATPQEKADALRGLVVAMPPRGVDPMMERFPPLVRARNWPAVEDIDAIAALVEAELAANPPTLRERYASVADADAARSFLLEATRLPPPMRIGNLPFVPQVGLAPTIGDAFVGRADDLWRIHDLLWTERGDPATAAGLPGSIEAIGGFGKTRLALEYLYRFGPRHFRGGLFWINAESDPELQLYDVLQALNPSAPAIEQIRQVPGGVPAAVARAIRSRPDDAPTPLFIIDNVPEPQPGEPPKPLDTWCPVLSDVPVLTTSRTRVALGGGSVVALPVDTLDPASAVELLTTEVRRDALEDADWQHIAEWVGHLPLALEVLNRVLRSGEITPAALLELSHKQRPSAAVDAAMESIRHVVPAGALRGITEAFSTSYNLLTPEEQYAARLIAWMAPAPVPTFVIGALGPEIFAPGIRAKLLNRSFVAEVRDGSAVYYGAMHRVLGDFTRAQSIAPAEEVEVIPALLTGLMEAAQGQGGEGSAVVRECGPLASAVFANWAAELTDGDGFSQARVFANHAGTILWQYGHPVLARDIFASVAFASTVRLGEEHPHTLTAMNNLAITRDAHGDHAGAQELKERVLEARQRILGEEHPNTLTAMSNLASTRRARGDLAGAQELQERVLGARWRILGEEHPDTLTAMGNLASTRSDRGDRAGAQDLEERVLEAMRRLLGQEHPHTLTAMGNLALTRSYRGDHAGAQKLQEQGLEASRRIFGEEHPATLIAMSNLAATRRIRGDYTRAQELQERVLEVRRRIVGEEHPATLTAMSNLAATRSSCGDHAGAQELQERVLEVSLRILGKEHPATLASMNNLASTWRERGDHAGAQELQERVLEAMRRILGEEHPTTMSAMNNLALTLSERGDHAGAQELQEQGVATIRRILGEEHPDTMIAMNNLALTVSARGDHARAQELQERVLEARRRILGEEHPDTMIAMSNLASTLSTRGDHARAQELQERVLEVMRRRFGREDPQTTLAGWRLLETYIATEDSGSADGLAREDLYWLLDRNPAALTKWQRQMQAELRAFVNQVDHSTDQA